MLKFIGNGSAFNTELGNNSAFIKFENILLLFDCGSCTFKKIQELNLLEGIEKIYILITHTHPDHVGSLGDLIFYGYYSMGKICEPNVTVIAPKKIKINSLLSMMGVKENVYYLEEIEHLVTHVNPDLKMVIKAIPVMHVEELDCFGYLISFNNTNIYYSGDCSEIPLGILKALNEGIIDYLYQDTCKADYPGNVHLSLRRLDELIDKSVRNKVYCMHLDVKFSREEAISLGFNVT